MKYKIGKSDLFYFENKQRKYIPVVSLSQEHDYIFNLHDVENDRKNTLLFLNNDVGIISLNEDKYSDKDDFLLNIMFLESELVRRKYRFRIKLEGMLEDSFKNEYCLINQIVFLIQKPVDTNYDDFILSLKELSEKYELVTLSFALKEVNEGNPFYLPLAKVTINKNTDLHKDIHFSQELDENETKNYEIDVKGKKLIVIINSFLTVECLGKCYFGKLSPKSRGMWYRPKFNISLGQFEPSIEDRFKGKPLPENKIK